MQHHPPREHYGSNCIVIRHMPLPWRTCNFSFLTIIVLLYDKVGSLVTPWLRAGAAKQGGRVPPFFVPAYIRFWRMT